MTKRWYVFGFAKPGIYVPKVGTQQTELLRNSFAFETYEEALKSAKSSAKCETNREFAVFYLHSGITSEVIPQQINVKELCVA